MFFFVERFRGIQHHQHQRGICQSLAAAGNAQLLRLLKTLSQPGCVYQLQRNPIERDSLRYGIAGRSRRRRYNRPFPLHQPIEERTLSRVRPPDNRQSQPVVDNAAARKRSR